MLATVGDQHLRCLTGVAAVAHGLGGDRLLEFGKATHGAVLVHRRVGTGRDGGIDDVLWCCEIRLAGTETDDVLTSRSHGLGLVRDRQRGRGGDGADTPRNPIESHGRKGTEIAPQNSGDWRPFWLRSCHAFGVTESQKTTPDITIPADLLPSDGRFESGPTKVLPEALNALAARATDFMGTSHRKMPVKLVVAEMRNGIAELLRTRRVRDRLRQRRLHRLLGCGRLRIDRREVPPSQLRRVRGKFAKAVAMAPHLQDPSVTESAMGTRPDLEPVDGVDAYAFTHNETSTGVMMDPVRVGGVDDLMLVDATSAAGGLMFDANATDVYYFAPQKALASDGGLWIAMMSPAAIERVERIANSGRYIPPSLNLWSAVENSRQDQTYNTPALATIFLTAQTVNWFNDNGGLSWSAGRSATSAEILYGWADASDAASPFVQVESERSKVVATIDFDEAIDADTLVEVLRKNGILDVGGYRKLGRNQLRIGMFPAIDPADTEALTACLDYCIQAMS